MTASSQGTSAKAAGGRCPICGAPAEAASRPFCSKRCADVDLARWLSGSYAIAGGQADADEDGDEPAAHQTREPRHGADGEDGDNKG
jgi:endogenous inhibitor of DNA gyrase (YacG/DUF329 family)